MARKRATPQEVAEFYEKMRSGTPEERLQAAAKYFKKSPTTIKANLKFWWPGPRFMKEFPAGRQTANSRQWDIPTDKLLKALNSNGSVQKTARALKTTPITLKKCMDRKGITQEWVLRS
jgi:transcriptional regulator with GAF, ATPase, and Fis domain